MSLEERLNAALEGRYVIERELGAGGMATVYLAEDLKHDRKVALKVLRPELAVEVGVERFEREIRLAGSLTHPHILALYDSGEADGFLYFVMPVMDGESLRDRLEMEKQLPVEDALRIAREVADALDYAHKHGVVHRDIKPENILLHSDHAVVADFGIGKAIAAASDESTITQTGVTIGTPAYMSPEQASGEQIDGRSDLYSLGCMLFEMLAGEPPFTGPTAQAIMAKRFTQTPPNVSTVRDTVPTVVSQVVAKLLAKTPVDRFQTGAQFIGTLTSDVSTQPADKSIAVLPFTNMSSDPENEFFSDGIAEDIISALTRSSDLRVAARSSAFTFKGKEEDVRVVGQKLGVRNVLEGSVRKAGNRVRVTAQLMDAANGYQLWSDRYDRDLDDIFEVQDEIARTISSRLEATIRGDRDAPMVKQQTENLAAYELYLRGRATMYQRVARSFETALEYFDRALALDPDYALAHAGRADLFGLLGFYGLLEATEAMPKAREAAERALQLDEELSEAHGALALVSSLFDWDWERAAREYERAIDLNRSNIQVRSWYAFFHLACTLGDFERAIEEARIATEIDPLAGYPVAMLSYVQSMGGEYREAVMSARMAIHREPHSYIGVRALALALRLSGDFDGAVVEARRAKELSGGHWWAVGDEAIALVAAGHTEDGTASLKTLRQGGGVTPWLYVAMVHAALGEIDEAFEALEDGFEVRDSSLLALKYWPDLAVLRGDPRFDRLVKGIGFPKKPTAPTLK